MKNSASLDVSSCGCSSCLRSPGWRAPKMEVLSQKLLRPQRRLSSPIGMTSETAW